MSLHRSSLMAAALMFLVAANGFGQPARISEETRVIPTYPFSEPNQVPMLVRDTLLYPYHSFERYARESTPRAWKVVRLDNDLIDVFVLPEVGGKVWGARVKRTNHEFIYRNEVMKFRNIALRGPWTSGGIEFNFGVIGHTPSTATPVDYALRENADGSVSCIVGAMDLPSRTHWRVEIRLPADRAYFETKVLWYNPTPLEQPYYNWMTAAAFARDDLLMTMPGTAFLEHSGALREWPVNRAGRLLPRYAENTFAGHKSYHVVGEVNDFFGGYYRDDAYGFGHWAPHDAMPGQKLWLWALSRQGGVWEDLLTDTDGQYVEFQAGRLLVQYSPDDDVKPISQAGFEPGATDRWSETWFPLEGTGGLTEASREGAMHVSFDDGRLRVTATAFGAVQDTLQVWSEERLVEATPIAFSALTPFTHEVTLGDSAAYRIALPALDLVYASDPATRTLSRPFTTDPSAPSQIPETDRWVFEAQQLARGRRYAEARALYEQTLAQEPWRREARLGMANLEYRRGRYEAGLDHARHALQRDAYDAEANFIAGTLYRALGHLPDAIDAYGWAARSMRTRSVAYVQLAEMLLAEGDSPKALRYAEQALAYDRYNLPARQVITMARRRSGPLGLAEAIQDELLAIDPLHHFVFAERYLSAPSAESEAQLTSRLRGEYPDQTLLELSIDYVRRGARDDAARLLALAHGPVAEAWRAWLLDDPALLPDEAPLAFAFPYRPETIPVLTWAAQQNDHWSWAYLLALNLWACDRGDEAAAILKTMEVMDFAPAYVARAYLLEQTDDRDPEADLRRAVERDASNRTLLIYLVRYLHERERWDEALTVSTAGRLRFPDDFNLDLLHVQALNHLERADEAIALLDQTHVLPSEHARESHHLYEQAHTLAALAALRRGTNDVAHRHLKAALAWPEHLGQGRPYQPEERLVQYLLGQTEHRRGNRKEAQSAWQAVIAASNAPGTEQHRLDILALLARARLGEAGAAPIVNDRTSPIGMLAQTVTGALLRGREATLAGRLATDYPDLFSDLDGRLLLQALEVQP